MNGDDLQRASLLLSMLAYVHPEVREKMVHELLTMLGYKLNERELKSLHGYICPQVTVFPTANEHDRVLRIMMNPDKKEQLMGYIQELELDNDESS